MVLIVACALPFLVSNYRTFQFTLVLVYAIALLGLNILTGYNGQISLGHGAFYAIGAYVAAILMDRFGMPYWATVPIAGALCLVVGFLFGLPALRLEGHYLALATFALGVTMPQLLKNKAVEQWTGGVQGIVIVKPDAPFGLKLSPDQWLYLFTLAIAVVMFVIGWNLIRGRVGRALVAIRDHPIAASAMGIDTARYKSLAFGVSAMYTGVAGALGAIAIQFVAPDSFAVGLSIGLLTGIVIGGLASIPGAIFGAIFIQFIPNIADQISKAAPWAIYGIFLIGFMFLMPMGINGAIRLGWARIRHRNVSPARRRLIHRRHPETIMSVKTPARVRKRCPRAGSRGRSGRGPEEVRPGRIRHRDQDRPDHAVQRPGVGLRHDRQGRGRVLQDDQRTGRHQRPQDQLHLARRRLQPAEDGGDGAPPGRAGRGAARLPDARHAVEHRDPEVHATRRRCRSCSSPPARPSGTTRQQLPWTMGWQPNYQTETTIYAKHILKTSRTRRSPCSTRTTTTARTT